MIGLSFLCGFLALALLGLADPGHYRRRIGAADMARNARRMRAIAWVAIVAALPFAMLAEGPVFGPILWIGILMLAAGLVWLALNLFPDFKRKSS